MALERGQRCFELVILDDLLRLGEADAATRARDVSDLVEGALGEAVGLHAQAVVSKRGTDLERGRFLIRRHEPFAHGVRALGSSVGGV